VLFFLLVQRGEGYGMYLHTLVVFTPTWTPGPNRGNMSGTVSRQVVKCKDCNCGYLDRARDREIKCV